MINVKKAICTAIALIRRVCVAKFKKNYCMLTVAIVSLINRENLTIMDVSFPDFETLENTAAAIGSNMFEGLRESK